MASGALDKRKIIEPHATTDMAGSAHIRPDRGPLLPRGRDQNRRFGPGTNRTGTPAQSVDTKKA
jgi:hypothetical protein